MKSSKLCFTLKWGNATLSKIKDRVSPDLGLDKIESEAVPQHPNVHNFQKLGQTAFPDQLKVDRLGIINLLIFGVALWLSS